MRSVMVAMWMSLAPVLTLAQGVPAAAVNVDAQGVALHGHDAVAYFTEGRAVPGVAAFEHIWSGARWRFATAANRDRFAKAPAQFAPQFGGYCAWAVSNNYTADIDPAAFSVVDGRLYLNYSTWVQARWRLDRDANIAKGQHNWPALLAKVPTAASGAARKGGR